MNNSDCILRDFSINPDSDEFPVFGIVELIDRSGQLVKYGVIIPVKVGSQDYIAAIRDPSSRRIEPSLDEDPNPEDAKDKYMWLAKELVEEMEARGYRTYSVIYGRCSFLITEWLEEILEAKGLEKIAEEYDC